MLECRTSLTVALGYRDLKPSVVGHVRSRRHRARGPVRTAPERPAHALGPTMSAPRRCGRSSVLKERGDALEAALNRETGECTMAGEACVRSTTSAVGLGADELLIEFVSYENPERGRRRRPAVRRVRPGQRREARMERRRARRADRLVGSRLADCRQRLERVGAEPRGAGRAVVRADRARRARRFVRRGCGRPLKPLRRARAGRAAAAHRSGCVAEPRAVRGALGRTRSDRALRDRLSCRPVAIWRRTASGRPALGCAGRGSQSRRERGRRIALRRGRASAFRAGGLAHLAAAAAEAADFRRIVPRGRALRGSQCDRAAA